MRIAYLFASLQLACLQSGTEADATSDTAAGVEDDGPDASAPELMHEPDIATEAAESNEVAVDVERDLGLPEQDVTPAMSEPLAVISSPEPEQRCSPWRQVSPTGGPHYSYGALWASSPRDIWTITNDQELHWDGAMMTARPIGGCDVWPVDMWGSDGERWIATNDGSVWHHRDEHWAQYAIAPGRRLRSVWGVASDAVWAVGDGVVARWDGSAWHVEEVTLQGDRRPLLEGVWAADRDDVWIVGSVIAREGYRGTGVVFRGREGAWQVVHEASSELHGIAEIDGTLVIAGHEDPDVPGAALRRFDGTWSRFDPPLYVYDALGIAGTSMQDLWSYGTLGPIHRLVGDAWKEFVPEGDDRGFGAAHLMAFEPGKAIAVHGALMFLEPGKVTYAREGCCYVNAVTGSGPNDVWLVGEGGLLRHWDGHTWTFDESIASAGPHNQIHHEGGLRAIWRSPTGVLWTVGSHGQIWRRADGAWTMQESPGDVLLTGIWGADDDHIWVTGLSGDEEWGDSSGHLYAWDGARFVAAAVGDVLGLRAIAGSSATDVWAVGRGEQLLHFDGQAWTQVPLGVSLNLSKVTSRGPGHILAGGSQDAFDNDYRGVFVETRGGVPSLTWAGSNEPILSVWANADMAVAFDSVPRAWVQRDAGWVHGERLDAFAIAPRSSIWSDGETLWLTGIDGNVYRGPPLAEVYSSLVPP